MAEKAKYKLPTVEELLESGVHFGHQAKRWHPKMAPYIFDKKKGIHIFDLYTAHAQLEKACEYLYSVAANGGKIVFVGTKKQAKETIENEAKRCGAMYITDRWVGGTITNFPTIRKNINKLKDFMKKRDNNELSHYTKKERLLIDREIEKLTASYGGIITMNERPDALFLVDIRREKTAVREASRQGVSIVALVDTNSDPKDVNFVIPGNDDAMKSIAIMVRAVSDAIEAGYQEYAKKLEDKEAGVAVEMKEVSEEKVEAATKKEEKPVKKTAKKEETSEKKKKVSKKS